MGGSSPGAGGAGIRLAGATSEVHVFDVASGSWSKTDPVGEPPSPRAAHAAAAVGHMVVVQGGIGPTGLAEADLHVLDFTSTGRPRWHRVMVQGAGPGARYAHTLTLVAQRFLIAVGGNDGRQALNDAWALDTSEKPYQWHKLEQHGEIPPPRMYASTCARQDGLLLLTGGRDARNTPLADAYGLARHRDGRWEWTAAPGVCPSARYQHSSVFVGGRLHVAGGALGGGRMIDDEAAVATLDTAAGMWCSMEPEDIRLLGGGMQRCRHAAAAVGPLIFAYGGLRGGVLLDDMLVSDDGGGALSGLFDSDAAPWATWLRSAPGLGGTGGGPAGALLEAAQAEAAAAASTGGSNVFQRITAATDLQCLDEDGADLEPLPSGTAGAGTMPGGAASAGRGAPPRIISPASAGPRTTPDTPATPATDVRLHHRAVVVPSDNSSQGSLGGLVRQLSIDQFEHEGRRVSGGLGDFTRTPVIERQLSFQGVHKKILSELLKPRGWTPPQDRRFLLNAAEINELCDAAESIFQEEPSMLQLRAPCKIFGDLHGQFGDLMRLFDEFGSPVTAGDITYIDYLFLGDYVDRGSHSLETICLLLALKVEYRSSIHMIRGNHEASDINALFGFRLECVDRLGEGPGVWAWQRINALFNWMPLAANIEGKILCMHGGIGRSIDRVDQIASIRRPITMEQGGQVLMDLLWSDPTTNDTIEGVQPSPRGPGLVTFGPDRVKTFCHENSLQIIVRAHECVMDGFERFAGGQLITLFSATNYCGTANNAGAILVVGRDLVMVPKLIHPVPPEVTKREDGDNAFADGSPTGAGAAVGGGGNDTWMQAINQERPPTPPRGRSGASPSLAYY